MNIVRTIAEARGALAAAGGRTIGFVPTMGALHDGHVSLIRTARGTSDVLVVSIFVNPLQFGPHEDLAAYPRDEARDLDILRKENVDVAFLPAASEMYPEGSSTTVSVGELGEVLEGAARPGHFAGVATIVTKLFSIVRPDVAWFGQKDAQQLAVIRQVVADLSLSVEIQAAPTIREPDGLAMSSRNVYLSPDERAQATSLFAALRFGADVLETERNVAAAEKTMFESLLVEGVEVDYAAVVDPDDFKPFCWEGAALLAVAGRLGSTRLIDNLLVLPTTDRSSEA